MRKLVDLLGACLLATAPISAAASQAGPPAHVEAIATFAGFDGATPNGPLVMDAGGTLYGTTASGGKAACFGFGCGTVFKLTRGSDSKYTLTTIHVFDLNVDGGNPSGSLIIDAGGALYGTAASGPPNGNGSNGTVFKLAPTASGYTLTTLYTFQGGRDGQSPIGGLVRDSSGALYGATQYGGSTEFCDCGTVFKLTPSASGYTESIIYKFLGSFGGPHDGARPSSPLVLDGRGNLYGETWLGGGPGCSHNGCGTVYELSPSGSGYHETILHAFNGPDGAYPFATALTLGPTGILYGATVGGGFEYAQGKGYGVVFALSPASPHYVEQTLYAFQGPRKGDEDGISPNGNLVVDPGGSIYGTTAADGGRDCLKRALQCGTVFKLTPARGDYTEQILYRFLTFSDGELPMPGFVTGPDGAWYGTTTGGGDRACSNGSIPGCGTVYRLTPPYH